MEKAQADLLMKQVQGDFHQKNRVLRGLQIFAKYTDNLDSVMAYEHDMLFAGDTAPEDFSEDELRELLVCGWFFSKEFDCWVHF